MCVGLSFDKHKIKQLDGSNVDQMPVGGNCLITQKSGKALLRQPPCTQPLETGETQPGVEKLASFYWTLDW